MTKRSFTRRRFIASVSAGSVAAFASGAIPVLGKIGNDAGRLAILGGTPAIAPKKWPDWPYVDQKMVDAIIKTTKSGIWSRIQSESGSVCSVLGLIVFVWGLTWESKVLIIIFTIKIINH